LSGLRKRLSGTLIQGGRSLILKTPFGEAWIVDTDGIDSAFIGQLVKLEGVTTGPDRIRADWIGSA
jgi:Protein of unknown function (DUF5818)